MKLSFKVQNIACQNCANTVKAMVEDEFGEIEIHIDRDPKEVTVEIEDQKALQHFKEQMEEIGFPVEEVTSPHDK